MKENFVDAVMVVCPHQLDYDVDEYLDFVLRVQYSNEIVVDGPKKMNASERTECRFLLLREYIDLHRHSVVVMMNERNFV